MIASKIWQRYIFSEILKFLSFFLILLYFVYIIIDLSLHSMHLSHYSYIDILIYYLHHFIKRIDIFLPISLVLCVIKVIGSLNVNNELVALHTSGISRQKLIYPFFCIAAIFTLTTLISFEFFSTTSLNFIENFNNVYAKNKDKPTPLNIISLTDGTKLVYSRKDVATGNLLDAFWVISSNEVWHIKSLDINNEHASGDFAEHFILNKDNELIKDLSYKKHDFITMGKEIIEEKVVSYEHLSISSLIKKYLFHPHLLTKEKSTILSHLHYKTAISLTPFLIVFALSPYCVRFSKNLSLFFISMVGLFGLISYYTLMDAMIILSENQVIPPLIAIWAPLVLLLSFFSIKFFKQY
jgi:lipopolysaccharide export system permease protein